MVIYSPKLSSDEAERTNEFVLGLIKEAGGEIVKTDVWGRRNLAYEIDKHTEGYYYVNYFQLESTSIINVKKPMNINEKIIRHMFVARDEK